MKNDLLNPSIGSESILLCDLFDEVLNAHRTLFSCTEKLFNVHPSMAESPQCSHHWRRDDYQETERTFDMFPVDDSKTALRCLKYLEFVGENHLGCHELRDSGCCRRESDNRRSLTEEHRGEIRWCLATAEPRPAGG